MCLVLQDCGFGFCWLVIFKLVWVTCVDYNLYGFCGLLFGGLV